LALAQISLFRPTFYIPRLPRLPRLPRPIPDEASALRLGKSWQRALRLLGVQLAIHVCFTAESAWAWYCCAMPCHAHETGQHAKLRTVEALWVESSVFKLIPGAMCCPPARLKAQNESKETTQRLSIGNIVNLREIGAPAPGDSLSNLSPKSQRGQ
jgi:hypothetical protein